MRFYRIIPNPLMPQPVIEQWRSQTHWLLGGTDRWTHETYYPAGCGRNVYGSVRITTDIEELTCESCRVELIAQRLRDIARREKDEEEDARDGLWRPYK